MKANNKNFDASCMDDFDPSSLDAKQALQQILDTVNIQSKIELLFIRATLNRVVAEDIHSKINVPGHTNSAMDGYALHSSSLPSRRATYHLLL